MLVCEEVDFEKAISGNPSYNTISKANVNSEKFNEELMNGENFDTLVKKYVSIDSVIKKTFGKIKKMLKNR